MAQMNIGCGLSDKTEELVGNIMRHILFESARNFPSKVSAMPKDQERKGMKFVDLIEHARRRFSKLFGYELYELPAPAEKMETYKRALDDFNNPNRTHQDREKKRKAPTRPSSKMYILRQKANEATPLNNSICTTVNTATHGLLMTIFGIIFLNQPRIAEPDLWKILGTLGLTKHMKNHPEFGDVNDLISRKFPRMEYLTRNKYTNTAGTEQVFHYELGPRCFAETTLANIYTFICGVMNTPASEAVMDRIKDDEKQRAALFA